MEWDEEKRGGGDQALGEPEAPGGVAGPPPPVCAGTRRSIGRVWGSGWP